MRYIIGRGRFFREVVWMSSEDSGLGIEWLLVRILEGAEPSINTQLFPRPLPPPPPSCLCLRVVNWDSG